MQSYLVFTLSANLGAMGNLAGHERRGSWAWPGRSAILGLLAAALGIRRDGDFSALDALSVAVAVFDHGQPMRDYHTVETVPSAVMKNANSRPEALWAAGKLRSNTVITLRDYRVGGLYGVAILGNGLEALAAALNAPCFTLYMGRKSCPLSAPPAAQVVKAENVESALALVQLPPWRRMMTARLLLADAGPDDTHVEERHDRIVDRTNWHFAARRVAHRTVEITAGAQ